MTTREHLWLYLDTHTHTNQVKLGNQTRQVYNETDLMSSSVHRCNKSMNTRDDKSIFLLSLSPLSDHTQSQPWP